jgi:hypothetical protein
MRGLAAGTSRRAQLVKAGNFGDRFSKERKIARHGTGPCIRLKPRKANARSCTEVDGARQTWPSRSQPPGGPPVAITARTRSVISLITTDAPSRARRLAVARRCLAKRRLRYATFPESPLILPLPRFAFREWPEANSSIAAWLSARA